MISRRSFVSILLLLAIVPIVTLTPSAPEAHGQALTTVTSYITTPMTVTSVRRLTVQTTMTSTFTTSYLTTSSLSPRNILFSVTVQLPMASVGHCEVTSRGFTAKKGQVISVNLTSNTKISFYKMNEKDYQKWYKTGKCYEFTNVTDVFLAFRVTSVTKELEIQDDGKYRFVFVSGSTEKAAKIQFKAEIVGATLEAISVITTRTTSQKYSWETRTHTTMTTLMLIRTEQVGFPLGQSSLVVVAVVLLVVILVVVGIALRRRRREKAIATAQMGPMMGGQLAAKRICINCGAELPAEAKFCTGCGSPTP